MAHIKKLQGGRYQAKAATPHHPFFWYQEAATQFVREVESRTEPRARFLFISIATRITSAPAS